MPENAGPAADRKALEMRLSLPAESEWSTIACELASRIAEHLGSASPDAASLGAAIEGLTERFCANGHKEEITFEFRQVGRELVIEARCRGESTEVRHPLPA